MGTLSIPTRSRAFARRQQLKQAVLEVFANSGPRATAPFAAFSEGDWQGVLWWLDISGMALYFLDRARRLGVDSALPERVVAQLDLRLQRNRERTRVLLKDARMLAGWFDAASVDYAVLKGISLTPDSVPESSLRWQADLDFLVRRKDAHLARHYINRLGYRLRADTGKTLEFIWGSAGIADVAEMYCAGSPRAFELHIAEDDSDVLARRRTRCIEGIELSTLSPADILVQQAVHLLKHLCGEHTRVSWALELRRHVEARHGDAVYWDEVERIAAQERNGELAMGMALWLAGELFGPLRTDLREKWRAELLPVRARIWLERYARNVLMSDSTGSKYYALLRDAIPGQMHNSKSMRKLLFPSRLPLRITTPAPRESMAGRAKRWMREARHFFTRLRFHAIEGLRFGIEALRWKKAVARCER